MSRAHAKPASESMAAGPGTPRPDLPLAAVLFAALSIVSGTATADSFSYFPDGPNVTKLDPLQAVLETLNIHDAKFETDGQSFIVPDANGDGSPVSLTARLLRDTGLYQFTFGAFPVEAVLGIDAPKDRFGWATAALTHPQTMVVFDDRDPNLVECGDVQTVDKFCEASFSGIPVGSEWFFFIIPNNTLGSYTNDPSAYWNSNLPGGCGYEDSWCAKPLFSYTPANPEGFDQMLSFIGNGETLFSFEDISRTREAENPSNLGWMDFSDLVFLLEFDESDATFEADDSQEIRGAADVPTPSSLWLMLVGLLAAASFGLGQGARRR